MAPMASLTEPWALACILGVLVVGARFPQLSVLVLKSCVKMTDDLGADGQCPGVCLLASMSR